jgi:hypothetical protein
LYHLGQPTGNLAVFGSATPILGREDARYESPDLVENEIEHPAGKQANDWHSGRDSQQAREYSLQEPNWHY